MVIRYQMRQKSDNEWAVKDLKGDVCDLDIRLETEETHK
jgi:hypothetical protein